VRDPAGAGARIGLDAHYLARPEGNRTYVLNLIRGWARLSEPDRPRLLVYSFDAARATSLAPDLEHRRLGPRAAALRVTVGAPLRQALDRLDLWHASWVAPPGGLAPLVLTIHDVLFATRPELFGPVLRRRLRWLVPRALRRARVVIVTSATTRRELLAAYPFVDPDRVACVPFGVDQAIFRPEADPGDARRRADAGLAPGAPYGLAVGRPDPRKGLAELLTAWGRAAPDLDLVLAGPLGGARPRLAALARAAGVRRLRLVDHPDEPGLAALYRGARAFCFPTRAEGVGVPALEALACGAPAVLADLPPLREAAAGAARFVPPGDADGLTAAVAEVLADDAAPAQARARGPARVAGRSLEAMARGTLSAYRAALER